MVLDLLYMYKTNCSCSIHKVVPVASASVEYTNSRSTNTQDTGSHKHLPAPLQTSDYNHAKNMFKR